MTEAFQFAILHSTKCKFFLDQSFLTHSVQNFHWFSTELHFKCLDVYL